jgi:hypothetical protein
MIEVLKSDLRRDLGDERFDTAWAQGRVRDLYAMLDEVEQTLLASR